MADYCRCLQAGFRIHAAKLLSDPGKGWQSAIKSEDVEKFLAEHKCEPVGDTPAKILEELIKIPDLNVPQSVLQRMKKIFGK